MNAWSGRDGDADGMGPSVTRAATAKPATPPLKNGSDLRESGYLIAVGSRTSRIRRKYRRRIPLCVAIILFLCLLIALIIMSILYALAVRNKPVKMCRSKDCLRSAANLALSMNSSADPCDNFYEYACGNWASNHPREIDLGSHNWYAEKQSNVYTMIRDFLEKNLSSYPRPVQQAKDAYTACMDIETLEKRGVKPVLDLLKTLRLPDFPTYLNATEKSIDHDTYKFDWLETVIKIKLHIGMDVLIGFDIFRDLEDTAVNRLVLGSPEVTRPFPSISLSKKMCRLLNCQKGTIRPEASKLKMVDDFLITLIEHTKVAYKSETYTAETYTADEKVILIYQIFYSELIKLLTHMSEDPKTSNLTETQLDHIINTASLEYYELNNQVLYLIKNSTLETEEVLKYTVDKLQELTDAPVIKNNGTPSLIWKKYLEGIFSVSNVTLDFEKDIVMMTESDLGYLSSLSLLVATTPPVALELYIWIKVVEATARHASTDLRSLAQRFEERLWLHPEFPTRSVECANAVNNMLNLAVVYGFADPYILNVTKPKILTMIDELKNVLAHLIGQIKWMDDNTKVATYEKIIQMKSDVGFPEWLLEEGKLEAYYDGIEIDPGKHLDNMINVIQVKLKRGLNDFRKVHGYSLDIDPTEVNAYHICQENRITIPLVMLQHPFFDLGLDSLNYGSLGTVIGHEIMHGFDENGRSFNKNGDLVQWWSNETLRTYDGVVKCFVDQYSSFYVPELNMHVDGPKTLTENIADNGGVREALYALKHRLQKYGPEEKLPGFERMTPEQLFFLSYGNHWCGVSSQDWLKSVLESDNHTPISFRVQGVLQNSEEFSRAFHCPLGSTMNPKNKCILF